MTDEKKPRERPILFSGPMVRAIIEGRKTQTRRVAKLDDKGRIYGPSSHGCRSAAWVRDGIGVVWNPYSGAPEQPMPIEKVAKFFCPYGVVGDRLWVREAALFWRNTADNSLSHVAAFKADGYELEPGECWRPSIHMPRWASRITLEITGVRLERLQSISEADAIAEGMDTARWTPGDYKHPLGKIYDDTPGGKWSIAKCNFASTWESINGPGSWDANPWVWVIEFKRVNQ